MLIISSSGKTLDLQSPAPKGLQPHFEKEANAIEAVLAQMDVKTLTKVLGASEKIAMLNFERIQNWSHNTARPSLFMYKGDVYRELHVQDYSPAQLEYAGRSVFAMSGLYGAVGGMEAIKPYRLEMKTKLKGYGAMNDYWRPFITKYFNELIEKEGHQHLLNLASVEYAKAVDRKKLKVPVIDVHFKEEQNGKLKVVGIMAKRARGMMIDFCIQNQIEDPADLRAFKTAGYEFIGQSKNTLTFAR